MIAIVGLVMVLLTAIGLIALWKSRITIGEHEVGILIKKRAPLRPRLPAGRLIAINGEAGVQARTLGPGDHWAIWSLIYRVQRADEIDIPHGQIRLVTAKDGQDLPPDRFLGRVVPGCANFADAEAFLRGGGEKGRQLAVLTEGRHRLNTELFEVVTPEMVATAEPGLELHRQEIGPRMVGLVTTKVGATLPPGHRIGTAVEGHSSFQSPQQFLDAGGFRGVQYEVLLPGVYTINPWFASVDLQEQVSVPAGSVGVVVSDVGQRPIREPGAPMPLVDEGLAGVRRRPLPPGDHAINGLADAVFLIPTNQIALHWSTKTQQQKKDSPVDAELQPLSLRSADGFEFTVTLTQVIKIPPDEAPRLISSMGTERGSLVFDNGTEEGEVVEYQYVAVGELVQRVLVPTIDSFFRNAAHRYKIWEFQDHRDERQREAKEHVANALRAYGVESVDTLIGEIAIPERMERVRTQTAVDEEEMLVSSTRKQAAEERRALNLIEDHDGHRDAGRLRMIRQLFGGDEAAFDRWHSVENWGSLRLPKTWVADGGRGGDPFMASLAGGPSGRESEINAVNLLELLAARRGDTALHSRLEAMMRRRPAEVSDEELAGFVLDLTARPTERLNDGGPAVSMSRRDLPGSTIETNTPERVEPGQEAPKDAKLRKRIGRSTTPQGRSDSKDEQQGPR